MTIDVTIEGPVARVTLNRPEKMNALTVELRATLATRLTELHYNNDVRAIIVTGAGKAFCTGADVEKMDKADLLATRERMQRGVQTMIRTLHSIEKPVIAAVRGHAVGVGWSIALACDLIVASETARFAQVFRRVGLAPDGGAPWFLSRLLGMARAKELIFSAKTITAEEALSMDLVNHVVPDDQLLAKAEQLAGDFAEGPTFAFGLAKKLMHMAAAPSLEDYLELENMVQPQLLQTQDHLEGVAAFKEKRKPNFNGR